jgi:hypothetical protein
MITGVRQLPWSAYTFCKNSPPEQLPDTIKVGLYEEFPVPGRLDNLRYLDFPVSLAVAAPSREAFMIISDTIHREYPMVHELYYWPTIPYEAGYYTGSWSDHIAVKKAINDTTGLPTMWDLEMPLGLKATQLSLDNWWNNRHNIDNWLDRRKKPVHIWRSHTSMGLSPLFLWLLGMHFNPDDYDNLTLHLNLYSTGAGLPADEMARIIRCGVEEYEERFIPSLGVLNDGEGPESYFIPEKTFRRDLMLVRQAGVHEVWIFGVNGLNPRYINTIKEVLPVEKMPETAGGVK